MAKKENSEALRKLALQYRSLTLEKYKLTINELETRLKAMSGYAKNGEVSNCNALLRQFRADYENFNVLSEEMFVNVVLNHGLLVNVIKAFDKSAIDERDSHLLSTDKALDIALQRQERQGKLHKMSIEELLKIAINNEELEIELLKIKIDYNKKTLGDTAINSYQAKVVSLDW